MCDSGDTDAVLPTTSTRYSIDALKLPTIGPWHAWYDHSEVSSIQRTRFVDQTNEMKFRFHHELNMTTLSSITKPDKWIII